MTLWKGHFRWISGEMLILNGSLDDVSGSIKLESHWIDASFFIFIPAALEDWFQIFEFFKEIDNRISFEFVCFLFSISNNDQFKGIVPVKIYLESITSRFGCRYVTERH